MELSRRRLLHATAGAAAALALPRTASAFDYPARPVRLFEGFGVGGAPDLVSRLIGQWLSQRLGQPFVIENRTGAGGNIATEAVVTAPADGYTLLTCVTANAINATLYTKLDFNFIRDIAPVAGLLQLPMVFLANLSFPAKNLAEFIAYAKANPGKVNLAMPGNGTPMHVAGELLKMMAGINVVQVPYRGPAPAYTDLFAGQVQTMIITVTSAFGHITAGKVRALAVTGATRSAVLPDVATVAETVPGFEATAWQGVGAPLHTSAEIIDRLNGVINAGLADPQIKTRLRDLGGDPMPTTPAAFGKFVAEETEKWAKVIRFAGIKAQ